MVDDIDATITVEVVEKHRLFHESKGVFKFSVLDHADNQVHHEWFPLKPKKASDTKIITGEVFATIHFKVTGYPNTKGN